MQLPENFCSTPHFTTPTVIFGCQFILLVSLYIENEQIKFFIFQHLPYRLLFPYIWQVPLRAVRLQSSGKFLPARY